MTFSRRNFVQSLMASGLVPVLGTGKNLESSATLPLSKDSTILTIRNIQRGSCVYVATGPSTIFCDKIDSTEVTVAIPPQLRDKSLVLRCRKKGLIPLEFAVQAVAGEQKAVDIEQLQDPFFPNG